MVAVSRGRGGLACAKGRTSKRCTPWTLRNALPDWRRSPSAVPGTGKHRANPTSARLLEEPDEATRTLRAVKTGRAPRVVVVGHAVLLRPPRHGAHNEDVAGREPDDGELQDVVVLLLLNGRHLAL